MALAIWLLMTSALSAQKVRVKDIAEIEGVRSNQLYGVGLVVGLNGTGGTSMFTQQVAVDMLQKLDITSTIFRETRRDNVFKSKNISVVTVTAELPPFARKGSRIDVTVSVLDDATSLVGGVLLLTPLRGADGRVYAVAQGPVSVGGFSYSGQAANAQKNHPTTGRIPGGAVVELEALGHMVSDGYIRLLLKNPDFATARAVAAAINGRYPKIAQALDPGTIALELPSDFANDPVGFLSEITSLEVQPDYPATVVINERTGTIVAGEHVQLSTVAIAHGNLAIVTSETPEVSQPAPFSEGQTRVVPRTELSVTEEGAHIQVLPQAVTVADLARALNALGVTPRDLIAIFQALERAGALHAKLIIM